MSSHLHTLLTWVPRLAGIAVTLFIALFALDALDGRPLAQSVPDFLVHLLPAALLAAIVAVAWRLPWVGAAAFGLLAIAYAAWVPGRPDWILAISGPLAMTAVLFALSASTANAPRRQAQRQS